MEVGTELSEAEPASPDTIRLGSFELDLRRGLLLKRGQTVPIRARSFALLAFLARNANRVISRDEIFISVWKGVAVTDDALTQTVRELRLALGDSAQEQIKTVTKRGYLLALPEPVAPTAIGALGDAAPPSASAEATGAARSVFAGAPVEPPRASIAVLPFANLSSDPEQDYFAQGLAEDLIADLSKLRGLTVIARHSSFAFADRGSDPRVIL
jgi:DNA-binding winged helix-turn-helix (wHTH) protein